MLSSDALRVLLAGRSGIYRLLQNALGNEPSATMLEQLHGEAAVTVFEMFGDERTAFGKASDALVKVAGLYLDGGTEKLDTLSGGFTALFVGPAMPEAPPWESYYLSHNPTLFEKITLEVRKCYVEQSLIPAAYPNVADDNIGIELDFLARLAERAEAAFGAGDIDGVKKVLDASERFLSDHLVKWAPKFASAVLKAKHSEFYAQVAAVLEAFLPIDIVALGELQEAL